MPGAPPSESISYHTGHAASGPVVYSPAVAPSSSYQGDHVPKPSQYPSNSPHIVTAAALPATTPQPPLPPGGGGSGGGPTHVRRTSGSETKSPTTVRQSPLSLASITSPFNTDAQSKNCHAQTPSLPGGRLRLPLLPLLRRGEWNGPAMLPCDTRRQRRPNTHSRQPRASRMFPWKDHPVLPWLSIYPDHRREGDTVIRM